MTGQLLTASLTENQISHPIATQLGKDRFGSEYTVYINVDNPLPRPIHAKVQQTIPDDLTVVSPNGGFFDGSTLQWRRMIEPHASYEFSFVVRNDTSDRSTMELEAAILSFYVPSENTDAQFDSAPVTIEAPRLPIIYMPSVLHEFGTSDDFNWIDATNGGRIVAEGDDTYEYVTLPFWFSFYGNYYSGFYVSSNGYISFGDGYSYYNNSCIPSTNVPNNAIYAFWDDLRPDGGGNGNVYVKQVDTSTVVIEWHQVRRYGSEDYETFEIILKSDGSITLQYLSMSYTTSATVGVENAYGTIAQQHACNGAGSPITDRLSIPYTTP